jgi:hypothetical protein
LLTLTPNTVRLKRDQRGVNRSGLTKEAVRNGKPHMAAPASQSGTQEHAGLNVIETGCGTLVGFM